MTNHRPFIDELAHRLCIDGEVTQTGDDILIHRLGDVRYEQPLTVHADDAGIRAAVNISTATRNALWPGTDPTEAGFNLLLVHLQELIDTGRTPIRIDPLGILIPTESPEEPAAASDLAGDGLLHSPTTGQLHPTGNRRRQQIQRGRVRTRAHAQG